MQIYLQCSAQNFTYNGAEFITAGTKIRGTLPTVSVDIYCNTDINILTTSKISYCVEFHTGTKQ
jgi:hypothetical protein